MKLIIAIVNHDDSGDVSKNLTANGFMVTKLATTGGFLMAGNTTFLIGTDDDKVDAAIEVIGKFAKKRKEFVPTIGGSVEGAGVALPIEVIVGGATVFVVDVDKYLKL